MKIQVKDLDELEELTKKPFEECTALISADFSDDSVLSWKINRNIFIMWL